MKIRNSHALAGKTINGISPVVSSSRTVEKTCTPFPAADNPVRNGSKLRRTVKHPKGQDSDNLRLADLRDPFGDGSLIGTTGFVVNDRAIETDASTRRPDRYGPFAAHTKATSRKRPRFRPFSHHSELVRSDMTLNQLAKLASVT